MRRTTTRAPFEEAMERLASRWRALALTALGLGLAIFALAPRYNDAQRAGGADGFRAIVEAGTPWRVAVAALVDVPFALTYGALGLALGWSGRSDEGAGGRRVRRAAGTAIALGAVSDLAENVLVLTNTIGRGSLADGPADAMRTFGTVKWTLAVGGALVLAVGAVVRARRR